MQTVGVLCRVHRRERCTEVEAVCNRVLNDVAVDPAVGVELCDRIVECGRRCVCVNVDVVGCHAHGLTGLVLLAHIAGAGPVISNQDGSEAGRGSCLLQPLDTDAHVFEHGFCDGATG